MFDTMSSVPTNANDPHSVQRLSNIPQERASALLGKANSMLEEILCKATGISGSVRGNAGVTNGGNIPSPDCMMDAIKANLELMHRIDDVLSGVLEVL